MSAPAIPILEMLEPRLMLSGDVIISQFMAINDSTIADEDGEYSDWIQLHNVSASEVDLTGWYLSDDAADLTKWAFPEVTLPADAYLLVFASGKDRAVAGGELHTNFKLSGGGEYLGLIRPDGVTVEHEYAPEFPPQRPDVPYGVEVGTDIITLIEPGDTAYVKVPTADIPGWTEPTFDHGSWTAGPTGIGYDAKYAHHYEGTTTLIDPGATVKILVPSDNSVADTWYKRDFDDSGWMTGTTGVGFSLDGSYDSLTATNIRSAMYRVNSTVYLRIEFNVPDPARIMGLWLHMKYDDGFAAYINGVFVAGSRNYDSPLWWDSSATSAHDASDNYMEYDASAAVDALVPGTNVLAIQGLNVAADDDDFLILPRLEAVIGEPYYAYGDLIGTDVQDEMTNKTSIYIRIPFTVDDLDQIDSLKLRIKYDDGFVAYLNGVEVARRNAPEINLGYNSQATDPVYDGFALRYETIGLTGYIDLLNEGSNNVLAIHGLNYATYGTPDDDFIIVPELSTIGRQVQDTVFSHDRGFYDEPFDLTITCATPGATIVYTTDGSLPTPENGIQVTSTAPASPEAVIHIDTTTTVRAAAFLDGWEPTNVDTQTYIFLDDVVHQPAAPAGWPYPEWMPVNEPANYDVDANLAGGTERLKQALMSVPTISIVMDPDDLMSYANGIYVDPWGRSLDRERLASVEIIDPNAGTDEQVEAGIRIQGGTSRDQPQRSFRLIFRSRYGDGKLYYPLFPDSPVDYFDQLILRGGSQDSLWSWGQLTSDGWMHASYRDMGHEAVYGTYMHVYLNGLYWGIYNPIERPNSAWAAAHMGGERDSDWDSFKGTSATNGNRIAMDIMMDIAEGNGQYGSITRWRAYEELKQWCDVEAVADYMILNYYAGTGDWRNQTNNGWVRKREDGAGWMPVVWDGEVVLRDVNADVTGVSTVVGDLHKQLLANPDYRMMVADHVHKHLFNDGALTVEANRQRYDSLMSILDPAYEGEVARWSRPGGPSYSSWVSRWNDIIHNFFPNRRDIVLNQFRYSSNLPYRMYPLVDAPEFNQHGGRVEPGFQLTITADEGTIYYSLDGTDPRMTGPHSGELSPDVLEYTGPITLTENAHVKARVLTDEGVWSALTEAYFAVGDAPLRITEIMYNPQDAPAPVTAVEEHFDGPEVTGFVNKAGTWTLTEGGRYHAVPEFYQPHSRLPLLQIAIVAADLPSYLPEQYKVSAVVNRSSSDTRALIVFDYHSKENFRFAGAWSDNQWVIGHYNYCNYYGSTNCWYIDAVLDEPIAVGSDYDLEVSVSGTAAALRVNGQTKLVYDFDQNIHDGQVGLGVLDGEAEFDDFALSVDFDNDDYEFIELENVGADSIQLEGMQLADGVRFTFPRAKLAFGQRAVVVRNRMAFESRYDTSDVLVLGEYTGNLANGGEGLELVDSAGESIVAFSYDDDWYPTTDGEGYSLVLTDPMLPEAQLSEAASWAPSDEPGGTPGLNPAAVVINEVLAHTDAPAGDWIELHNVTDQPIDVGGWYLSDEFQDMHKYQIPTGTVIPAGGYLVLTQRDHFGGAFGLSEHGERVVLLSDDTAGPLVGYYVSVSFGSSPRETTYGRYLTNTGPQFTLMSTPTMGQPNADPLIGPVVINEIMYHPAADGDEFIELLNISDSTVQLYDPAYPDHTWQLEGATQFAFGSGMEIPAGGMVVLTNVDVTDPAEEAAFRARNDIPAEVPVLGPYTIPLPNAGGTLGLYRPGEPDAGTGYYSYIPVDVVAYDDVLPWDDRADGTGPSLERADAYQYGNDPANWQAVHVGGSPGRANVYNPAAPVVDAGEDQTLPFGYHHAVTLDANVVDDGYPAPANLTVTWEKLSGPDPVSFDDPYAVDTVVHLPGEGTYVLRLTADDGDFATSDELTITVGPTLLAHAAAAGTTSGLVPVTVDLAGSAEGGLPAMGYPAEYTYSWDFGDGETAQGAEVVHTYQSWGVYDAVLTVSDGVSQASAAVNIIVGGLMGDANGDGKVGIADLNAVADNWGQIHLDWAHGDFTGEGAVGIADLAAIADNYGHSADGSGGGQAAGGSAPPPADSSTPDSSGSDPAGAAAGGGLAVPVVQTDGLVDASLSSAADSTAGDADLSSPVSVGTLSEDSAGQDGTVVDAGELLAGPDLSPLPEDAR